MDTAPRSGCPIKAAVEVLGDPWATLVLRDNMFGNRRHFRELIAGSEEGIATNILASRLKQLVAAMMDELGELHLGVPRPDPDAPRASDQLRAAYEAALLNDFRR